MDTLLRRFGSRQAVFVTAYNPFSRRMPETWNRRMLSRMAERLRRRPALPASGHWKRWAEAHLLIFGDVRPICRLARFFRQNAIVTVRVGQPARLLFAS